MRVLHVAPYFAPAFSYGGPPRSILGLCQGLQHAGAQVQVFTTAAGVPEHECTALAYQDVPVRYFPLAFPRHFFRASGLRQAVATSVRNFDLVHIHCIWNMTSWAAARETRLAGVPYVISPRGMLEDAALRRHSLRKQAAYAALEQKNLNGADGLHATSTAEARTLARLSPQADIAEIPNGVRLFDGAIPERGQFRRRMGIPAGIPLLLFLGRLHPIKRLDVLAQSFDLVARKVPSARLVIAGGGDHQPAARRFFDGMSTAVHWIGEVSETEKWSLLVDANLLVMCSDSENFGMSVLEALTVGTPVVTSKGCPWEAAQQFGCGLWVDQQPTALADAIVGLLSAPEHLRSMGERGKVFARQRYGWDSIAQGMTEWYAKLLHRPRL